MVDVDWMYHENHVRRIQEHFFRVTRDKAWGVVKNLQKLLVRSLTARLVAVRRVTQDNKFTTEFHGKSSGGAATRAGLEGASPVPRKGPAGFLVEGTAVMPSSYSLKGGKIQ